VTKHTLQIPDHRKTHVMCQRINRAIHIHRKSIQLVFIKFTVLIFIIYYIHDES